MIQIISNSMLNFSTKTHGENLAQSFGNSTIRSVLENEEVVTNLRFFLIHAKEKHSNTNDKRLYWEMIKIEIRDFCVRFAKLLCKYKSDEEMDLLRKLIKRA